MQEQIAQEHKETEGSSRLWEAGMAFDKSDFYLRFRGSMICFKNKKNTLLYIYIYFFLPLLAAKTCLPCSLTDSGTSWSPIRHSLVHLSEARQFWETS